MNTSTRNGGLRDNGTDIVPQKSNNNSILDEIEEVKKKKKNITMLLGSVKASKQANRFVKPQQFKVSIFQIQQYLLATPL